MLENIGAVLGFAVVGYFFLRSFRRRAGLTLEQRQLADQAREIRELKREQDRRKYD